LVIVARAPRYRERAMATNMVLTPNVDLMDVTDPMVPFSLVEDEFRAADISVFSILNAVSTSRRADTHRA
jgi:hypothetical protein